MASKMLAALAVSAGMALASSPIINAVGRLQTNGRTSRMMIARANPAPPRMSSMAYGPPDTMKNVAATKGHSVSLAMLFFA